MDNTITLSELIQTLQSLLKQHGNLPVYHIEFGGLTAIGGATQDTCDSSKTGKQEKIIVIE